MLGWLIDRDINPHIPVLDKAGQTAHGGVAQMLRTERL
ncbi:hypothetical protein PAM7971_00891 [Pacificibacter marinus]|uniref:Uncharacterized protein n=1 Tax=Pacificibacter marinus TaxID=658057 RepID=A0A1Y5RVE7_9RHOB|nr:hypothetical protein PAM7971_00891 [Pacificibacter marinus]